MAFEINTNINSLIAQKTLNTTQAQLSQTLNRLSSGLRINSAKDDAAGLAISESMEKSVRALKQGSRNGNDGISLIQTTEAALDDMLNSLQRMRELSSQASNGTYASSDLTNLDTEYQALKAGIDRVSSAATFNGVALTTGGTINIQVGEGNDAAVDQISFVLPTTSSTSLGISSSDITSASDASTAMGDLDTAISSITTALASLGATYSNIDAAVQNNESRMVSLQAAKSRITDVDFAEESANLAKLNILSQSGVAMLAQANNTPQMVLQLLRQ
jgi:flagellin